MNQPNNPCPTCGQYNNIICSNSYHLWVEPEIETDSLHVGETLENSADNTAFTNSPEWKAGVKFLEVCMVTDEDERFSRFYDFIAGWNALKQQLSEAGESKWIDVKDKLPSIGDNVILNHSVLGVISDKCVADGVHSSPWKSNSSYGVTHWQPLPSAPNETTNVATRSYTHEQVLAFGEKIKELAAEKVDMIYHNGHTKCDLPLKYFQSGADNLQPNKESILSIDLNKIEIK